MILTEEQQQAKDKLLEFVFDDNKQYIVLQGIAGTGKSTIIKQVHDSYLEQLEMLNLIDSYKELEWYFTATTNKACNNLQALVGQDTSTIHSLLNIKLNYIGVYQTRETIYDDCILVIDECSYIDYQLLDYIKKSDAKVIFMGDDTQLPPVGLNHSPVSVQGYETIKLTKQMRQKDAKEIADNCLLLIDYINKPIKFPNLKLGSDIIHIPQKDFDKRILDLNDNDKVLSVSNHYVNRVNKKIFEHKHKHFSLNDKVINNHYVRGISTDELVTITDMEYGTAYGVEGTYFTLKGNRYFMPRTLGHKKKLLNELYQNKSFAVIDLVKNTWVDLRPPYALTIHKSQGSTFDNVYINLDEFKRINDPVELARLLYVAISRASKQVIFTGDIT